MSVLGEVMHLCLVMRAHWAAKCFLTISCLSVLDFLVCPTFPVWISFLSWLRKQKQNSHSVLPMSSANVTPSGRGSRLSLAMSLFEIIFKLPLVLLEWLVSSCGWAIMMLFWQVLATLSILPLVWCFFPLGYHFLSQYRKNKLSMYLQISHW